jgi:hypothetical protein
MSIVQAILDRPEHPERIDRLVRRLQRRHRGWVLVDAMNRHDYAWMHARPFVKDEGFTPGLRREGAGRDITGAELLGWLAPRFSYALVAVRPPGPPPPELARMLVSAREIGLPFLVLEAGEGEGEVRYFDGEGRRRSLPPPEPLAGDSLGLRLKGGRTLAGAWQLPLTLEATLAQPRARLEVELTAQGSGFRRRSYGFLLERARDAAAGTGRLVLDVRPDPEERDELVLRAEGFAEPLRIQAFKSFVPVPQPFSSRDEPWQVHVLFDRTTLDVDQWPAALSTSFARGGTAHADGGEDRSVPLIGPNAAPPASWNLRLRHRLAAALPQLALEMPAMDLHLWWFADMPRDGIERHPWLESPRAAFAPCGRCPAERLGEVLESEAFGYCPGLDVYDAVDEALAGVALAIAGESERSRHAVIVVGDSPPPPRDPLDPFWRELPGRSVATNARCSGGFRQALADLAALRVPVGWLFIRSPRGPAPAEAGLLGFGQAYPAFQSVKERVLGVLRATEGLITVETGTEDDLEGPLRRLGALLGNGPGGIEGVELALGAAAR